MKDARGGESKPKFLNPSPLSPLKADIGRSYCKICIMVNFHSSLHNKSAALRPVIVTEDKNRQFRGKNNGKGRRAEAFRSDSKNKTAKASGSVMV